MREITIGTYIAVVSILKTTREIAPKLLHVEDEEYHYDGY